MRKAISRKTRFEVFKRDSFKCQYCGRGVPDVVLELDHVTPISGGGADDLLNYVTSCFDCNRGKGSRKLSDESVVQKSRASVRAMLQRREQLDMVLESRRGYVDPLNEEASRVEEYFRANCGAALEIDDSGRKYVKALIRKFGAPAVIKAIDQAAEAYLVVDDKGQATAESCGRIFRSLRVFSNEGERGLYYIRGILRKRLNYVNEDTAIDGLRRAARRGVGIDTLRALALDSTSWSGWISDVEQLEAGWTLDTLRSQAGFH